MLVIVVIIILIFYPSKSVQKLLSTSERRFYPQIRDGNWNWYNVIIMRSITDRVTRAKSDTKDFRNKRLCSSTLWGIYKEG